MYRAKRFKYSGFDPNSRYSRCKLIDFVKSISPYSTRNLMQLFPASVVFFYSVYDVYKMVNADLNSVQHRTYVGCIEEPMILDKIQISPVFTSRHCLDVEANTQSYRPRSFI